MSANASRCWLIEDEGTRGGGTTRLALDTVLVEGASADFRFGWKTGVLSTVGDGAGEASEDARDGIEACEGPLPLFHAAALRRASKLAGRSGLAPSSLAITHPLLL